MLHFDFIMLKPWDEVFEILVGVLAVFDVLPCHIIILTQFANYIFLALDRLKLHRSDLPSLFIREELGFVVIAKLEVVMVSLLLLPDSIDLLLVESLFPFKISPAVIVSRFADMVCCETSCGFVVDAVPKFELQLFIELVHVVYFLLA